MSAIDRHLPEGRLSRGVVHGDLVYVAGTTADHRARPIKDQTAEVLAKIDGILAACGSNKSRLLTATVYVADMRLKPGMDEAWLAWVDGANPPARATVEARLGTPQELVEIQCIAVAVKKWRSPPPPPRGLRTDCSTAITQINPAGDVLPGTPTAPDATQAAQDRQHRKEFVRCAEKRCNCLGFTFGRGRWEIDTTEVSTILRDNYHRVVEQPARVCDVIVYGVAGGTYDHVGLVVEVTRTARLPRSAARPRRARSSTTIPPTSRPTATTTKSTSATPSPPCPRPRRRRSPPPTTPRNCSARRRTRSSARERIAPPSRSLPSFRFFFDVHSGPQSTLIGALSAFRRAATLKPKCSMTGNTEGKSRHRRQRSYDRPASSHAWKKAHAEPGD
ncbi:MAG: hypothetical protein A3G24_22285 [Betaproteobacteria bacterium RIFCSPLOWO2_12_FULL_62_13]|nr:MAG: hypothetical protein A3G24_22285 [Betaproteobacteria bacterium RIFCSPLOWO2_12_FULL_62_13]